MEENSKKDTKVLCVAIQKGGCGKSLLSLNLAYALSQQGKKVLLCDIDPQATSSLLLNVDITDNDICGTQDVIGMMIDTMSGQREFDIEDVKQCIRRPVFYKATREKNKYVSKEVEFGFDLMPARIELANYDIELNQFEINGQRLGGWVFKNAIDRIKEAFEYDYIVIDCLPGLNMLAYSSISASYNGGVIMPINMDKSAITGGENLLTCVTEIQELLWKRGILHKGILGVVKNKYKPNLKINQIIDDNLFNYFGPAHIFETTIPNSTQCDRAHNEGRLYAEFYKPAGEAFDKLATEIINQIEARESETEPVFIKKFGKEYLEELEG